LVLSNLDKVFYPATGFTKGDVISYYRAVSEVLLPHLRGRPVTLKRYPDGVNRPYFYEKKCPSHRPPWIKTVVMTRARDNVALPYCQLNSEAALVWATNLGNLELHVSLARSRTTARPSAAVFDLDPGAPAGVLECAEVALRLKGVFESAGLAGFVKTSGSKGLQVYVPLNTPVSEADVRTWAHSVARSLEDDDPESIVTTPTKAERPGKIFVDWSQNNTHKTTVCVYSLRAQERPTVSTPVGWEEVARALDRVDPSLLSFEAEDVLGRISRKGDLFEPVITLKQRVPRRSS
jgi:bifunctional non-homologous end joining protein LigD